MSPQPPSPDSPSDAPSPGPRRRGRPSAGGREAIVAATVELLRELGASRLTTREVAARAGVSEGSVFYHFHDRTGLLTAVISSALESMQIPARSAAPPRDVRALLEQFAAGTEALMETAVVAMIAAQSDDELRTGMASYLTDGNLGPHRGVEELTAFLQHAQRAGIVRADADVHAVATALLGMSFFRVTMRQMLGEDYLRHFASRKAIADTIGQLLAPLP